MRIGRKMAGTPPGPPMVCLSTANEMTMGTPCMFVVVTLKAGVGPEAMLGRPGFAFDFAEADGCAWLYAALEAAEDDVLAPLADVREPALEAGFFAVAAFFPPFVGCESALRFADLLLDAAALNDA